MPFENEINIERIKAIEKEIDEKAKPTMLFGRDIKKIPCFKDSMLYGIYSAVGFGVVSFMFTSCPLRSTQYALASCTAVSLIYSCFCRYDHARQKYAVNDLKAILAQNAGNKITNLEVGGAASEQKSEILDI
ncbi:hypothetical protein HN011_004925 [Eciton burchellii]|nr:hypothetical protein HN011_004925 [Eciton burchellii]